METELHALLYDHATNRSNLDSLLKEYDPRRFIAFIGAGVSAGLAELPGAGGLYRKLCIESNYKHPKGAAEGTPEAFACLQRQWVRKETFDKRVLDIAKPKDVSWTAEHFALIRAFKCFVTTNWYDPIEKAVQDRYRDAEQQGNARGLPTRLEPQYFDFPDDPRHFPESTITYLHGNSGVGFCVIREEDYRYFYPSLYPEAQGGVYVLENSLTSIFCNWTVVFFGCRLEENLRKFLRYLKAKISKPKMDKSTSPPDSSSGFKGVGTHYWVVATAHSEIISQSHNPNPNLVDEIERQKQNYFSELAEFNIRPIIYTGGHAFVEKLCQLLVNQQRSKAPIGLGTSTDPTGQSL